MSELQVQRTPQLIAAEINAIHSQTQRLVLYNSIEIGRRLAEAKSLLNHGEWTGWLKESVDYSQSTANNFMRIFQEYGADQISLLTENNTKSSIYDRLTYSQAVALLALPGEEREGFIENNDIEEMSTRELQEAIKAKEAAEKKAKEVEEEIKGFKEKIDDLTLENLDLSEQASKSEEAVKEAAQKEKQAAEKKVKDLEEKIKSLEEVAKQTVDSSDNEDEDIDIDEEREKIRTELQEEMARNLEREKKHLQAEIDQAKSELEAQNKKIKELEATGANEDTQRFKVMFEQTVNSFKSLIQLVTKIKASDEDTGKKYSGAVEKALSAMSEEIKKYM